MGTCMSLLDNGPLPFESIQTPTIHIYTTSSKSVYHVTAALYPNGDLYLVHWEDGDTLPMTQQKVESVEAVEHGVVCHMGKGGTTTFKRLGTGDIINVESRTITLHDELGTTLFPMVKNDDLNKFRVLFPDKLGTERKRW